MNAVYILSCVVQHQVCTLHGSSMEYFQSQMFCSVYAEINAVHILRCVALQCPALSAPSLSIDFYTVFIQLWQFLHYCSMYTIVLCTCLKCSTSLIPRPHWRYGYETRRSRLEWQSSPVRCTVYRWYIVYTVYTLYGNLLARDDHAVIHGNIHRYHIHYVGELSRYSPTPLPTSI